MIKRFYAAHRRLCGVVYIAFVAFTLAFSAFGISMALSLDSDIGCSVIFGNAVIPVKGDAMSPSIHSGGLAFADISDKDIERGDTVAFTLTSNGTTYVAVRRVAVADRGYLVVREYDGSNAMTIRYDDVIGSVGFSLPLLGWYLQAIRNLAGFALLILLPLALILGIQMYKTIVRFISLKNAKLEFFEKDIPSNEESNIEKETEQDKQDRG